MKFESSSVAKRTTNPIRNIVDRCKVAPNPGKEVIQLSLGDPTVFGHLKTCFEVVDAMQRSIGSHEADGYAPVTGTAQAKEAIAKRYQERFATHFKADDIVIASGCSGALDLSISVLCTPGKSAILTPSPGFTLYGTLCDSKGIRNIKYPLLPDRGWEVDLDAVVRLLEDNPEITAWLINNPSNPCGSVYSEEHLKAILNVAEKYKIVLIADEIYEDMTLMGHKYFPLAKLSGNVPILTCSGLAKRFLVPGWRFGWIAIHDAGHDLSEIRRGLFDLSGLIIGANTLIQAAISEFFKTIPESFYDGVNRLLEANASLVSSLLSDVEGLTAIKSQGAMYMLIGLKQGYFKGIKDDIEFSERLLAEQSVAVLPGTIFGIKDYFRIVYCAPEEKLREACCRMREFCEKHAQTSK